ncbi:MAG: RDD family protein [Thermoanaerobaculia bacterium]
MARFDEVELIKEPEIGAAALRAVPLAVSPPASGELRGAPLLKRALAFLTDVSLFLALGLALSPLVPTRATIAGTIAEAWVPLAGLVGFLLLVSFHYFVVTWTVWGRTIGAMIFEVKIVGLAGEAVDAKRSARRWLWTLAATLPLGLGFFPAAWGEHRSMPDRMSGTRVSG